MSKKALLIDGNPIGFLPSGADDIAYDNTTSQMTADNVQDAVDELNAEFAQSVVEVTLTTNQKIEAVKFGKVVTYHMTPSGSVTTASAGAVIGTLPSGYRPKYVVFFTTTDSSTGDVNGRVLIRANGEIVTTKAMTGYNYVGTVTVVVD